MRRSHRILLVEDNPNDVALALRAFEKTQLDANISVADNGEEALHYLFNTGRYAGQPPNPMPDLILLDLNLIRVGGFEVLRGVRADPRTKRLPIVVMSSSNEPHDILLSYDLGANSFIRKPVSFTHFLDVARQLVSYWLVLNEPLSAQG